MFTKLNARRAMIVAAVSSLLVVGLAASANAAAYDLAPVTTGITDQITALLPIVLPVAGGILALFVGWRLIKRMTSA